MLSSVKVTLGPKGENVIINQSLCSPFITNDGVTIASNIESDDIVVNTILELAKEASIKTLETAGDGTTTTLVLLEELYKEGVKLVDNKVNPIIIREQLNTESQKVVNLLDKYSKKPTKKELLDIAVTASNDIEIGKNICNAYLKVKDKDLIDIKETNNRNTTINYVKGYSFDTCIASYYYFKENVIKMDDVYVLITNKVINEIYEIEDILNIIINDNKNLVIIADDYGENLVNQMVSMYLDNNVFAILLKNSYYGDAKNDFLVDVANISLGKIQNGNYREWYEANHYYNPYLNKWVPTSIWTEMRIKETSVNADAYKFDYRLYYDVFVKKSYASSVWAVLAPTITITMDLPDSMTVKEGNIIEELTCISEAGDDSMTECQWYRCSDEKRSDPIRLADAVMPIYALDKNLTSGTYYYFAKISAEETA